MQNASDLLIKPLENFRKEQIGFTKVSDGVAWFIIISSIITTSIIDRGPE